MSVCHELPQYTQASSGQPNPRSLRQHTSIQRRIHNSSTFLRRISTARIKHERNNQLSKLAHSERRFCQLTSPHFQPPT